MSNKRGGARRRPDADGAIRVVVDNRRARHDYEVLETLEAGLVLQGTEVKSLRGGRASLTDSYAQVDGAEAWLLGAHIPEYTQGSWTNHEPRRPRKLLLHKAEIERWYGRAREQGLTVIPLKLYWRDGRMKVELALAKGKARHDRRRELADRDAQRQVERALVGRRTV